MSEPDPNERLKQLEERIAAAKKAEEGARHQDEHYSKAQQGWRMVIEMVAGVLIGSLGRSRFSSCCSHCWGLQPGSAP